MSTGRDLLVQGIREIPGVEFLAPAGAFYAWLRFDTDLTSEELCDSLLEHAKIAGGAGQRLRGGGCGLRAVFLAASDEETVERCVNLRLYQENSQFCHRSLG